MKPRRPSLGEGLLRLAAALGLGFLVVPLLALLLRAIQQRAWEGALNDLVGQAIVLSALSTLATLGLTLAFGTPLAYVLARRAFPGRRLLGVLVELPIVLPPAVAGLALLLAFGRRGLLGPSLLAWGISLPFTFAAVVLAQIFVAAPFYIRAAQVAFQGVSREIEEAAQVDGAAGWALFRRVTLPLCRRPLLAGLILAWARALGEFGATILFAGSLAGRTQTMPLLIYTVIERDLDAALWTGLLLLGLALLALLLAQSLARPPDED